MHVVLLGPVVLPHSVDLESMGDRWPCDAVVEPQFGNDLESPF